MVKPDSWPREPRDGMSSRRSINALLFACSRSPAPTETCPRSPMPRSVADGLLVQLQLQVDASVSVVQIGAAVRRKRPAAQHVDQIAGAIQGIGIDPVDSLHVPEAVAGPPAR